MIVALFAATFVMVWPATICTAIVYGCTSHGPKAHYTLYSLGFWAILTVVTAAAMV